MSRFFEPGDACRLLQPIYDARAHPASVRSSHASGALAPLHADTRWVPVALTRDTLPHRRPVSRILLTMAFAHRDPLAWTSQTASRDRSSKGRRALFKTISRVPLS